MVDTPNGEPYLNCCRVYRNQSTRFQVDDRAFVSSGPTTTAEDGTVETLEASLDGIRKAASEIITALTPTEE
jgi:hypothetical protein